MLKKIINYIDLGVHYGQEIDLFLKQFDWAQDSEIRIYGVEANQWIYDELVKKYENIKNVKIFHCAINDKNEPVNLYIGHNDALGSSTFSTKKNVTSEAQKVEGITFNDFIQNNVEDFENSYNILKMNIEGAEMFVYEDMMEHDLLKHFDVLCGHPSHDVEKISELDNSDRKQKYYDTIKENNIDFLFYCADSERNIQQCVDMKKHMNKPKPKNLVFMMDIDIKGDGRYASSRRAAYKYSIDSWKRWCDKNDCELFVLNDLILENDKMGICWQRYYLFDILDANEIEYDQVLMVDADTIVHPDCPNFFEMTEHKLCGAQFDGSWDWVLRGIENYSKYMFDGYMMPWHEYFDCGFIIVNDKHRQLFQDIVSFYFTNQDGLIKLQETFFNGTDQTPVNILVHKHNVDLKLLPYEFNMNDMNRKEILGEDLLFTKIGWIYQYNAIPNNKDNQLTNYFMEKTYKHFYGELNE